jgi:hypothetical protein
VIAAIRCHLYWTIRRSSCCHTFRQVHLLHMHCSGKTCLCMSPTEQQWLMLTCTAQRAEEIAQVDPKVAYYCRLYAIDQVGALALGTHTQQCQHLHRDQCATLCRSTMLVMVTVGPEDPKACQGDRWSPQGPAGAAREGQAEHHSGCYQ